MRTLTLCVGVAVVAWLVPGTAGAQTPLTLEDAATRALTSHPAIDAAGADIGAAAAGVQKIMEPL